MARPTRTRRPPLKLSQDYEIVSPKTTKTRNKIAEVDSEETPNVVATKTRSAKGNLLAGKKTVAQRPRSPVLRDRTNLPAEPFKVDILKKGADNKTVTKATKSTRQTAKSTAIEEDASEALGNPMNLRQAKAKSLRLAKEPTKSLLLGKENTENARTEEKAKKPKATKKSSAPENPDNSLVVESENQADLVETKVPSVKAAPKKIVKRVAFKKLSLSKREQTIEKPSPKSLRGSSELQKKGEEVPASGVKEKRFFKSKAAIRTEEKEILPVKKTTSKRKIEARQKARVSTSFRLRQTTLGESFAKQAARKQLRPRVTLKNYRDQSTVLEKTADKGSTKGPVYKTAKLLDNSQDDGSEIYEFHFDKNDSQERIATKKKRKAAKSIMARKTRAKAPKKTISKPAAKIAAKENKVEENRTEVPAKMDEPMETDSAPAADFQIPQAEIQEPEKIVTQGKQPEKVETRKAMPRIVEAVELTGERRISLTSTPQLMKTAETHVRPSRTTNAFSINGPRASIQYRAMQKHALLNKSLSPIKKALENFDAGSPWRSPALPTGPQFSRVKNVVQSTPQIRKFSTLLDNNRNSLEAKSEPPRMNKISENDEKNGKEAAIVKPATQALAKSPRKFGTVISNVNLGGDKADRSPRKNVAPPRLADVSDSRMSDGNCAFENFDDHVDKENSVPVFTSPKKVTKSPTKVTKSPKKGISKQSPLRHFNPAKSATKENWEPQPGPSGLQKRSPLGESRILQQSNLNNFLNIEQVPTSTRISAAHGIFADAHSTPIPGKPVKTIVKDANLENAFGFDDLADSDLELSPIKHNLFADPPAVGAKKIALKKGKDVVTAPTRFSIGEIKKHLKPAVRGKDPVERIEEEEKENRESKREKIVAVKEKVRDPIAFTDTFDVMAAETEAAEDEKQIPLFEDLEPVRFKEPPRHSYKRKRVAFNFSEDEEEIMDNSISPDNHHGTKKRKVSKVEKQRQKKLDEWAKDLNNTFEEIDHFDLVVEKQ